MQACSAHAARFAQSVYSHLAVAILLNPGNGPANAGKLSFGLRDLSKQSPLRALQDTVEQFSLHQRCQKRNVSRLIQQRQESQQYILNLNGHGIDRDPACLGVVLVNGRHCCREFRKQGGIEKQHQRDVWMSATYVNQLARKRQIQRADQIVRAVIAQQVCVDGDPLAALKEKADHRPIETWRLDRLTIADMQFDPRD